MSRQHPYGPAVIAILAVLALLGVCGEMTQVRVSDPGKTRPIPD